MLERMADFFEKRLSGYDEHMLGNIEGAKEFYKFTAEELPRGNKSLILDLGCGTGLELEEYFKLNPTAQITGIDLSSAMLGALSKKFSGKELNLICGSYFEVPFEKEYFDAAVSVESLHHFTENEKLSLYKKLLCGLKPNGYFILTDYFAESDEEEQSFFEELKMLKQNKNVTDNEFYHFDTPLTVEHEIKILKKAGFSDVNILRNWGATYTVKAKR